MKASLRCPNIGPLSNQGSTNGSILPSWMGEHEVSWENKKNMENMDNMEEMEVVVEAVDRVAEDRGHSNEDKIVSSREKKFSTGEAQLDQANFGSGTKRNLLVTLIL